MVASTSANPRSEKANKVRAILAGGLVLGVGAAFTLAAWTDNEWVFGQSGNGGGPGTKIYEMQQNTWSGAGGTEAWSSNPDRDGGALTFSVDADNLVPGSTVYAPMQLRAVAGSEALSAGLTEAAQSSKDIGAGTNSSALYAELKYQAFYNVDQTQCRLGNVSTGLPLTKDGGIGLNEVTPPEPATTPVGLSLDKGIDGAAGAVVNICFALTLPRSADAALQGKQTVPLWKFSSTVGQS
ncbi:hypothetical protein JHV56_01535 [Arthrobacter sp. BHU FT2]|nr:hypothetical protein [Arthrobacter sp. BHU FT2]